MAAKYELDKNAKPFKLNSILISHYAEKVRWCMEYCNIPFDEEFDSALFGKLFFNRSIPTLFNQNNPIQIGNSSDILRYLYGLYCGHKNKNISEKVEKLLKPTVESLEMESLFDEKLGTGIQKIFYYELIRCSKFKSTMLIAWGLNSDKIPYYQRLLLQILFPFYKKVLTKFLNLSQETYDKSIADINEIFELIEEKLKTNKYIMGDELTFVDITFASLAAHLVVDGNVFANGLVRDVWPDLDNNKVMQSLELAKHVEKFRKMKAAQYVRDIYKQYRPM